MDAKSNFQIFFFFINVNHGKNILFSTTTIAHNSVLQTLGKICSPNVYENLADGKQFAKFSLRFPI
jgi:hypothetical protein